MQGGAEAEHVERLVGMHPQVGFGRGIAVGAAAEADGGWRFAAAVRRRPGDSMLQVDERDLGLFGRAIQQDVARLHVPVDDAVGCQGQRPLVHAQQHPRDLQTNPRRGECSQRPASADMPGQVFAGAELHHHAGLGGHRVLGGFLVPHQAGLGESAGQLGLSLRLPQGAPLEDLHQRHLAGFSPPGYQRPLGRTAHQPLLLLGLVVWDPLAGFGGHLRGALGGAGRWPARGRRRG